MRDFVKEDFEAYSKFRLNPNFSKFYTQGECTEEFSQNLISLFLRQQSETPRTKFQLAICIQNNDEVIGSCGVRILKEKPKTATFGCELNPNFWNIGFASEASEAILEFGFNTLNLEKIISETYFRNENAILLAKKLGFKSITKTKDKILLGIDKIELI